MRSTERPAASRADANSRRTAISPAFGWAPIEPASPAPIVLRLTRPRSARPSVGDLGEAVLDDDIAVARCLEGVHVPAVAGAGVVDRGDDVVAGEDGLGEPHGEALEAAGVAARHRLDDGLAGQGH